MPSCDRACRQARIHGKGHVGGRQILVHDGGKRVRQALSAELRRRRKTAPAGRAKRRIGVLESARRGHGAVVGPFAALKVARAVQRLNNFLAEFCTFAQDRFDEIRRGIFETGKIAVTIESQDVIEQEEGVKSTFFI